MKIGAHVSIVGGYGASLESIVQKGGNCMQIFASSPRFWSQPKVSESTITEFKNQKSALNIENTYFHACYLINLANPERIGESSVGSLTGELTLASKMGIEGSIIHLGSLTNGTYETLITNIQRVLGSIPSDTVFIIENAGTRKIGTQLEEIGNIVRDVGSDQVKVCLDTCHLHAAGYDLSTKKSFEQFFLEFDKKIGLEKLEVIHMNDSKDSLGSNRDRHENIGEGQISPEVFTQLLNHPITKDLPFILEVPGFDKKGPDKKNIDIIKNLIISSE
ncbi:MAG TPA: deoxyribonuclease IV [Candidatus Levybacteria bacterium]|nr:deoxyribonuclease IV [Candidatus Levybacteria bacterium]